jgi:hypothetical protein
VRLPFPKETETRAKYLWAEAINYATWLTNRLPSRAIPDQTPYGLMHGTKPDLSLAREFGAPCFVHVGDAGKLDARAEEAIFVGIDAESKVYQVYWAGKRKVSVERNVTFPINITSERTTHQSKPPSTPTRAPQLAETPPAPRATRTRPPPGYYASLHEGGVAASAMEPQLIVSELPDDRSDGLLTWYAMAAAEAKPTLQQALSGPDASE